MKHPSEADLALLAGGDCGRLQRFRMNRHVSRCGDCRDTVASFGELRSEVRNFAEPDFASKGIDWDQMTGEMRANIHLGLAAGECVAQVPVETQRWGRMPRFAVGMATVALLVGVGIFLHGLLPHDARPGVVNAATVESTRTGVEVRTDKGSMTLMNQGDVAGDQTVTAQGAIRASYVDGTTGTVTVTSVYVE